MSESSLVPERQLVFSPALAATLGLEEAVLLQQLHSLFQYLPTRLRDGYAWLATERSALLRQLPFWSPADLQRIVKSLVDKGVLLVEPSTLYSNQQLTFALNETTAPASAAHTLTATGAEAASPAPRRSAARLSGSWAPSEDLLQLLALNHNIPRQFALEQVEEFIGYWQERGETSHAWENKFRQRVIGAWRREQQAEAERGSLDRDWRPSQDAVEIMLRDGVDAAFIEEAIPEFVLYWRERGEPPRELNSRFLQHIRLQWARYHNLAGGGAPAPIRDNWQPDRDVYDILRLSHIDETFARAQVAEFIVYWRDSGQAHASWNSKFLQHVKYQWARQHHMQQAGQQHDGSQQGPHSTGRTRDRSLSDDLNDTSWAN